MIQLQISVGGIHIGHLGSLDVTDFFFNSSRSKRVRDMGMVSLSLSCHDASTGMEYDPLGSTCDLT